ncbi:MAG: hypothetical protein ACKVYV_18620 [Limisphaerales bacterium]
MFKDATLIHEATVEFVTYLRSLDGDDHDLGIRAADNFKKTLTLLEWNFEKGILQLKYDITSKGVLDWNWTNGRRREIERHCDTIFRLLHPGYPEQELPN